MVQEKHGFVYIWYDRKHQRYYIGCHWGNENDGYICSSSWMKSSYKRRPHDFRRKILSIVTETRGMLLEEEHRWLSMIKPDELGKRYYNLTQQRPGHWSANPDSRSIRKKMSDTRLNDPNWGSWIKGKKQSEEHRRKHSESKKGRRLSPATEFKKGNIPHNKGVPMSKDQKKHLSDINTGKVLSAETRQKMSETHKGKAISEATKEKIRQANIGKTHSVEAKAKMRDAHLGKKLSEETKRKIGEAGKGRKLSEEARAKISAAQKGINNDPRSVKVSFEGEVYGSLRSAAKATGKSYQYVRKNAVRITTINLPL